MRSALSQRPTVLAEGAGCGKRLAIQRAISLRLQRARGVPIWRGKLQAVAVTWARTSGGKTPRRSRAGRVSQRVSDQPALAPFAHHAITGLTSLGNLWR